MLMNNNNYKGVKEMAKITIEELSGSLKEYLNGLGLTEAQVQELIDKFEDEKIGDISKSIKYRRKRKFSRSYK